MVEEFPVPSPPPLTAFAVILFLRLSSSFVHSSLWDKLISYVTAGEAGWKKISNFKQEVQSPTPG